MEVNWFLKYHKHEIYLTKKQLKYLSEKPKFSKYHKQLLFLTIVGD